MTTTTYKCISALLIVIGVILMTLKILEDSEPGAIPLLLVALGIGLYLVSRSRTRRQSA